MIFLQLPHGQKDLIAGIGKYMKKHFAKNGIVAISYNAACRDKSDTGA